ncbi:hypothetical protein GCM10012283_10930 [Phycicoccus endophyticus]|nr:hypothetical protein GCM10012283_10930 [Phycicoccus endophyticus]
MSPAPGRALTEVLIADGAAPACVTEVEDPAGRDDDAFARMARQVDAAARTTVRWGGGAQFPR